MKRDDARAIEHFERAIAGDPRLVRAHLHLAEACERTGRFDEAAQHYRAVLELDAGNARARDALTALQRRQQQEPQAPQEQQEPQAPQAQQESP
jgi:cytochrome c-type biogenesis protein CcmH/NrfG